MKQVLLCILATTTLLSCGSDTKPAQQSAAPAINFKTNSVPVPFAGNWISETYLSDIKEHQSPRKAQENIEECYIQLPDQTLRTSTMVINFHEGISDLVMVSNNGAFQLWEKTGDTLSNVKYTIEPVSADSIKTDTDQKRCGTNKQRGEIKPDNGYRHQDCNNYNTIPGKLLDRIFGPFIYFLVFADSPREQSQDNPGDDDQDDQPKQIMHM